MARDTQGFFVRSLPISAEPVALIPQCEECEPVWLPHEWDRWRCYLDDEDNLAFYYPACAEREFGDDADGS